MATTWVIAVGGNGKEMSPFGERSELGGGAEGTVVAQTMDGRGDG